MRPIRPALALAMLAAGPAAAGLCDYRPSAVIGARAASIGAAVRTTGFYTLTHASTGLTMLGPALGGSSGGSAGLAGGAGGFIGSAAATLMAPATLIAAAAAAAGLGAFEGACVFAVDRVTDPAEVRRIVETLAAQADPEYFRLAALSDGRPGLFVRQGDRVSLYALDDLYIADGVLKNRDWIRNTTIGTVSWVELQAAAP